LSWDILLHMCNSLHAHAYETFCIPYNSADAGFVHYRTEIVYKATILLTYLEKWPL